MSIAPVREAPPQLPLGAGKDWNPDVYRYLLCALLDYGELTLGQVRALLDRAGASELPLGGYVDMAVRRGDAVRRGERLCISDDGVHRRELAESTAAIVLSEPQYRVYLDDAVAAAQGDRAAEIRRDQQAARYKPWDRRVFGGPMRPERVHRDLEGLLLDRSLASFPVARPERSARPPVTEPFLDAWERDDLSICCPPYLAQLQGGVAGVNRILREARSGRAEVTLPNLATRPVAIHGGLLHPGEPLPRSVPDTRSLRLRLLLCSPYPALVAALLLLHRQRPDKLAVQRGADGWVVRWGRAVRGPVLGVCDGFARHRGWLVSRRAAAAGAADLVKGLEVLGIAWITGQHAVLDERFFGQLRDQPEEFEIFERLQPLAVAIEDWLSA